MRPPPSPSINKTFKEKRAKAPRRITETYLHNAGLYYLQRYAASSGHFRRVMERKIKKSCAHHTDQVYEECLEKLENIIQTFLRSGLLNDQMYIESQIRSLKRKGASEKAIIAKLQNKSVPAAQTTSYLKEYQDQHESKDTELIAALTLCRRKKIGPFQRVDRLTDLNLAEKERAVSNTSAPSSPKGAHNDSNYQKDLAKLARAGFSYDTATKAMSMPQDDAMDRLYGLL